MEIPKMPIDRDDAHWDEDRIWEYADRRAGNYSGETRNTVRYEVSECMRLLLAAIHDLESRLANIDRVGTCTRLQALRQKRRESLRKGHSRWRHPQNALRSG